MELCRDVHKRNLVREAKMVPSFSWLIRKMMNIFGMIYQVNFYQGGDC